MRKQYGFGGIIVNYWVNIVFFALLVFLYGFFFISNFSGPLAQSTTGDTDQWEYMGYYLLKNLSFSPLPHLQLISNQTFFPYGTNHVFQGWAFESNIWYAVLYRIFGVGPWLNIYYLISLFIASVGTYLLLRLDYGDKRAWLAGLMVSLLNFYALNKYPGHFAYSIIHWTVISIVTDFILVRRLISHEPLTLKFVLFKGLIITLCLGMDVGYIMGFAFTSFIISIIYSIGILAYQFFRQQSTFISYWRKTVVSWFHQWQPIQSTFLLIITVILALFYIPLLAEVASQSSRFTFSNQFAGYGWVHPARLLMPYLPWFSALTNPLRDQFHDMPEGAGAGSPGWLIVSLATIGFWYTPKAVRRAYVPIILFFALYMIYHPIRIPSLQIFPWGRFNRIPDRATLTYPIIGAILALYIPKKLPTVIWLGLVFVGILEVVVVYQYRYQWKPYYFPPSFNTYIEQIRKQPGEAILDWPFCVTGGNGVGSLNGLCPLYGRNSTLYSYQRFHGKKTIGQYFGRLSNSQIQPFLRTGWPGLLNNPDKIDIFHANQINCFTADQWAFFDEFYKLNDFAGINLCVDLLPATCVQAFYIRYGKPIAVTEVPGAGHLAFIPKSTTDRVSVNSRLGKSIRYPCGCLSPTL